MARGEEGRGGAEEGERRGRGGGEVKDKGKEGGFYEGGAGEIRWG